MMNCPNCGSADIRVSRHPHAMDAFYRLCDREAYRCRKCRYRFYGAKLAAEEITALHRSRHSYRWSFWRSSRERKRLLRRALFFGIFVAAFIIFWYFLRYITTERIPSDDTPPAGSLVMRAAGLSA